MPESTLSLVSAAFANNATLPALYTCDGEGISPPLSIAGVPSGARSLAIILEDPDVPRQLKPDGLFVHWVLFNIAATTTEIAQGEAPDATGLNSAGKPGYYPPCPPAQYEPSTHRYIFHLYALDTMLDLNAASATRDALLGALQGHILAQTELVGKYGR